jgi:Na+-translocating ferredoxin:NAD+ oxidoreductase RnfC subunit
LCPRYLLGHPIEPHKAMRSLGFNLLGQANIMGAAYCCECNLCSLYACPEDLDPQQVCRQAKQKLVQENLRWDKPPFNASRPGLLMAGRKAPMARLMQKLGLRAFRNEGPLRAELLPARRVGIALKQHVGAPCQPTVKPGQAVRKGDLLGQPPMRDGQAALGANVHASIDGKVTDIENGVVWIEKDIG